MKHFYVTRCLNSGCTNVIAGRYSEPVQCKQCKVLTPKAIARRFEIAGFTVQRAN